MKKAISKTLSACCLFLLISACNEDKCMTCQLIVSSIDLVETYPEVCGSADELDQQETDFNNDEKLDVYIGQGIPYNILCIRE